MPREPKVFKVPRKKPGSLPEPEPQIKPNAKAKKELSSQYTQKEKQEAAEKLKQNAEKLKQNPNKTELLICEKLIEQKIEFEFRAIVHGFIPNFYFPKYKKVIVLDGKQFRDKEKQDARSKTFKKHNIKIHCVNPQRLFRQTDWVMEEIVSFITGKPVNPRYKKSKKKESAQIKTPDDYLYNSALTWDELGKQLDESDTYENFILSKLER